MQGNDDTALVRMGGGAQSTQALCCCQELVTNMARMTFEEGQISLKKGKSGGALHCILASNWWPVKQYLNGAKIFSFTDAVQLYHYKTLQVVSFMLLHLCFRSLFLVTKGQMWSEPWCSSPRALLYSAATSLWPKSPLQNRRTETTLNVLALESANCRRKGTPDAKGDEKMKSLFRCCWERSQAAPPRQPWQLPRDVAALDIRQRTE